MLTMPTLLSPSLRLVFWIGPSPALSLIFPRNYGSMVVIVVMMVMVPRWCHGVHDMCTQYIKQNELAIKFNSSCQTDPELLHYFPGRTPFS